MIHDDSRAATNFAELRIKQHLLNYPRHAKNQALAALLSALRGARPQVFHRLAAWQAAENVGLLF